MIRRLRSMPSSIRSDRRFNRGAYCGSSPRRASSQARSIFAGVRSPPRLSLELARERSLSPLRCICRKFDSEAREEFPI
jgi:hypothetical protein